MTSQRHTTKESLPSFTTTSEAYAHDLYRHTVDEDELDAFLEEKDLYDVEKKEWSTPSSPVTTGDLLGSVFQILSSIVQRFVKPTEVGVERETVNTQDISACQATNDSGYRACPVVVVRAAGPSFPTRKPRKATDDSRRAAMTLGFGGMATYFVVKPERELGSKKEILDEMKSYARRILKLQTNRFYVRSLIVTEKHVHLFHFDRSGSQISPPVDIHKHPATFVRLVAGLSSTDERLLGIDDSVQWTTIDGSKNQGTVTTTTAAGTPKTFPILEEIPIPRESIRSRATTCWRVQDPDTREELVVKDSWRTDDRPAEHEMLELVKGIPGVVQMVSCEPSRLETKDMRCPSTIGQYQNRVLERVTMKAYSGPIETFTTVLQLLGAIRDAIAGHQRLVGKDVRILHRDVSLHNILLGPEGASEGERGVLVDLDLAFRATDAHSTVKADFNIGTRIFQSVSVLASHSKLQAVRAHDYLDDLESFFFVLVYIFLRYRPDGTRVPEKEDGPSLVREWDDDCPTTASLNKDSIFTGGAVSRRALHVIKERWGPVCKTLFEEFQMWLLDVHDRKTVLLYAGSSDKGDDPLHDLHTHRDQHYSEVLALFDSAIETLKASEAPAIAPPPGVCSTVSVSPSAHKSLQPSHDDAFASSAPIHDNKVASQATNETQDGAGTLKDPESSISCEEIAIAAVSPAPPKTPLPPSRDPPSFSSLRSRERSDDDTSPLSPQLDAKRSITSSNTASTPPITPPTTPPRMALAILSNQPSPSSPGLKRRSEDAIHPESPPSKLRRMKAKLPTTEQPQ